jgi:hypothetical protein
MYRRSLRGASPEQLEREFDMPADEIEMRIEAARLCFEKQCLLASFATMPTDRALKVAAR